MNELGSKFVENGERSRASGDGARPSTPAPIVASSLRASAKSLWPLLGPQRSGRGEYVMAALGIATLAAAGFILGRMRGSSVSEPAVAAQHAAPSAASAPRPAPAKVEPAVHPPAPPATSHTLASIPFVPIEVEPAHAEIWLDREVAGIGRVQLGPIDDGALHELRFVAPGHETKSLFFRSVPPGGRVVLKRVVREEVPRQQAVRQEAARQEAAAAPALPLRARSENAASQPQEAPSGAKASRGGAEPEPSNRAARAPAPAAPSEARARPSADDAAPDVNAAPARAPRVQLIEVHMPRVEVLD